MILSFRDRETERVWAGEYSRRFPRGMQEKALIKLRLLNRSRRLDDLRIPPGNRLEKLKGDRRDQYSIRIDQQWRICFGWKDGNAYDVEIVDYH
ncbi:MAG TPA: type II toxin-antitoxin system RelE/ParE family toxin [Ferrovibrio sp.]|jgi:proteic killer suppression protein|uniref:type II toxin-antitoxin system RelE/ParE family toxin n=1 Tax=Ferrovibrio sp. TaxID=1917215 RepID=UPI002B4B4904|nr:type II toxin-antitoxin system RelE/ParE family toxin [Ferrovibrio sp.]HLT77701.1 type II toxin-antitoxin system RelE/ParE family toxin [Ferrovibrio sp.]